VIQTRAVLPAERRLQQQTTRDDGPVTPHEQVAEANRAFYGAFEARDLRAMGRVWERSERVAVTHPGWPLLRGWDQVEASWRAIFANTPYIQFFLTDEDVTVDGDVAWVTLYENILQEVPGSGDAGQSPELGDSRVAATNVFCRTAGRWRMVVHHGSPVARGFQPD
jgi:ketosteroid isomerase-like protein